MLRQLSVFALLLLTTACFGQKPSPAKEASGTIDGVEVSINWSSPAVKGRTIWGDLVPYDKVWRTGANEATVIRFDEDVTIEGQALPAGEYALFTIPTEGEWTIIFNEEAAQWGAYKYDDTKDALRVRVKPQMVSDSQERLEFMVEEAGEVKMRWEKALVAFSVAAE
ncbi:MAG: DUF2911 domain-containing protein [Catalinimonas sp.]